MHAGKLTRLAVALREYRRNFFRRRHYPAPHTLKLLRDVYPNTDWSRVHFYEGLPWFTPPVAPYVTAQVLPRFYSFGGYNIYMRRFDEDRAQCLADILHEGFHVMQAMSFGRGYGFGFFRIWMIYYLAEYMRHGYRGNAFEVPAYNQEYRFLSYCSRLGIRGVLTRVEPRFFDGIAAENDLVFPKFQYRYRGKATGLIGSFFVCIAVTLLKPVADLAIYVLGTTFVVKKVKLKSMSARNNERIANHGV